MFHGQFTAKEQMYREYATNENCAGHPKGYSPEDRLGKNIKDCRHHKN